MSAKPRLLDLFCCEGGAAMGYSRAGFDVYGVDWLSQPRYPFARHQGDVVAVMAALLAGERVAFKRKDGTVHLFALSDFVAIHASPGCQGYSEVTPDQSKHPRSIPGTRTRLIAAGVPFVIENVRRARPHMIRPISLFGTMFDCHVVDSQGRRFDLSRERLFETNWGAVAPTDPGPRCPVANVFGGHIRVRSGGFRTGTGTGRTVDLPGEDRAALAKCLMGMPWATMAGCSEAVPPAYTEYLGRQLLAHIQQVRAA